MASITPRTAASSSFGCVWVGILDTIASYLHSGAITVPKNTLKTPCWNPLFAGFFGARLDAMRTWILAVSGGHLHCTGLGPAQANASSTSSESRRDRAYSMWITRRG